MSDATIEADGLAKSYAGRRVLEGITLQVQAGESLALIGLNGAGKTTLLRCLLDFQRPEQGSVRLGGIPGHSPKARRRVAFLPERFQPPTFLTGREFLRLAAELHEVAWDPAATRRRCEALALDWDALRQPVGRLSKGNAQKLGLAACLLSEKALYILDEPFSGLDVQARRLALDQLLRLREEGRTLLFTCHEPADVEALCHRLALLHEGRLRFCDTPDALRARHPAGRLEDSLLACLDAYAASDRAGAPVAP